MLALGISGHLAAVYFMQVMGWWDYPRAEAWLRFLPVTLLTAMVALFIERHFDEGTPLKSAQMFQGWSRPLYLLVLFDIMFAQLDSLQTNQAGMMVSLIHAILIAVLASFWLMSGVAYVSLILSVIALIQSWANAHSLLDGQITSLPIVLAELAVVYGLCGYGLTFLRRNLKDRGLRPWLALWELPLQRFSMVFSWGILTLTLGLGLAVIGWTIRAIFGLVYHADLPTAYMVTSVLALLGLLYLAAAFTHRWLRLGYMAMGMLLVSWVVHIFFVQQWDNLQWYAIPAGLYLLGIGYLEWQRQSSAGPLARLSGHSPNDGDAVLADFIVWMGICLNIGG